mmetsp:Transcript_33310/g.51841  ORF Transcript_33310/g.51841 Transcript_33310/m.51841 type:complete len:85 (-) Transcript_33310:826-1080(-)
MHCWLKHGRGEVHVSHASTSTEMRSRDDFNSNFGDMYELLKSGARRKNIQWASQQSLPINIGCDISATSRTIDCLLRECESRQL